MTDRRELLQLAAGVAAEFLGPGCRVTVRPYGEGLINDTFLVTGGDPPEQDLLLQRINPQVFPQPQAIAENLRVLFDHAARRQAQGGAAACRLRLPRMRTTGSGRDLHRDAAGGFWRAMDFIAGTKVLRAIEAPHQAREAGRVLGCFHALGSDLDPRRLRDTLPGFHVTPRCLEQLDRLLASRAASASGPELRWCTAFVAERRSSVSVLEDAKTSGRLQQRVIHGDPKLDNILFDHAGERALALIDLDTVKPGLWHYDLGDCLRSCCGRVPEPLASDTPVRFDRAICRALLGGYVSVVGDALNAADVRYLFDAIRLIPFELGLRFLTDHLAGDRYFKVQARGHNLHRALIQFALTRSIEEQEPELRELIEQVLSDAD